MTRLIVEAPGQVETEVVDVGDGENVLLGRLADATELRSDVGLPEARVRGHAFSSPSVSANHAVAWLSDGDLHVRDLGSRNGTWLRLPPGRTVRLPQGDSAHLRLASSIGGAGAGRMPDPPRYRAQNDYGRGVAHAVSEWLQRQEIPARAWITGQPDAADAPTGTTPLRLANGESLVVRADVTVDAGFNDLMAQICRYVSAQNLLYAAEEETRTDGMILASPAIRQVHRRVVELARQSLQSLILLGASGTGKERLAITYHRHLGRSGPLVAINCAMLSRDRMIADLFGAEAGAYTGAQRTMIGGVERADGGTLFLDEIGEIPLDVQPLLLRFLETGEYQRMGAIGRPHTADVRVIVATNRDLRLMAREGSFRPDLFFRLALDVVEVPPLRDRFADTVAYLASQSLGGASAHDALQPDALELLRRHSWAGNFRELVNLVRRLPRPSGPGSLDVDTVRRALDAGALAPARTTAPPAADAPPADDWLEWMHASARAFMADYDRSAPETWGDMTLFIEQYLKPHALVHMAGVADDGVDAVSIGKVAERVRADRGTVVKQLRRYFESLKGR